MNKTIKYWGIHGFELGAYFWTSNIRMTMFLVPKLTFNLDFPFVFCLVGRPPEILEPLLDTEVVSPAEANLECDVDLGDPASNIVWYKDNKEIRPSNKWTLKVSNKVQL